LARSAGGPGALQPRDHRVARGRPGGGAPARGARRARGGRTRPSPRQLALASRAVNLRTFLPPLPLPTAAPPGPGEPARELPDPGLPEGRPGVVAFLRHTGCPFAEVTARALREAAAEHPEIEWVAVSHARTESTARWRDAIGGLPGVRVLIDTDRVHYATWCLGRTSLTHFA